MKLVNTVEDERDELERRIDAYLEGLLSPAETRATERMLADPEVAAALGEAIALRELLAMMPDEVAPDGLADRIIVALGVEGSGSSSDERAASGARGEAGERLGPTREALYGASWMVRGPLHPLTTLLGSGEREEPRSGWWRAARLLGRGR